MIERALAVVTKRIHQACALVGRDPKEIELVLVTKSVDPARVKQAYDLGARNFGENRVQELLTKKEELPKDIRWHFIGSLQSNKIKPLIGHVALIHSLDRIELARELEKQAAKQNLTADVLIQVNTSHEETKHGFEPEAVEDAAHKMSQFKHLKARGLMTIGPLTADSQRTRESFRLLRTLQVRLKQNFPQGDWHYLSMGMSSDFEIAIAEGANLLRIGTAVFGARPR